MFSVLCILIVTSVTLSSSQLQYRVDYRWNYASNSWESQPQGSWYYYSNHDYELVNGLPANVDTTEETSRTPTIFNTDLSKHGAYDGPLLTPYPNLNSHYKCKCQKCYTCGQSWTGLNSGKVYMADSQYYEPEIWGELKVHRVEDKVYEPEQKYKFLTPREIDYPSYGEKYLSPVINNDDFVFFKPLTSEFPINTVNEPLNDYGIENINYYKYINDLPNNDLPQTFPSSIDSPFSEWENMNRIVNEKSPLSEYQDLQLNNELKEAQKLKSPTEDLYELSPKFNQILKNYQVSIEFKQTSFHFPKNPAKDLKEES